MWLNTSKNRWINLSRLNFLKVQRVPAELRTGELPEYGVYGLFGEMEMCLFEGTEAECAAQLAMLIDQLQKERP